uniref:Glyco_tran_10_N domain-containing protein n=1 Tax=Steinernema glaseri TaxID=37863 RepID=A0A1I7ZJJ7_9BILA
MQILFCIEANQSAVDGESMVLRYRTWNKLRRLGSVGFSCLCISLLIFFLSVKKYNDYWAERELADYYERHPVILAWTKWFGASLSAELTRHDSKYPCEHRCTFTDDRRLLKYAKALVFHDEDINLGELPPVDRSKIHIYYNMHSPDNSKRAFHRLPMDFFKWTLTYRQESTFWKPFDQMENIDSTTDESDRWTEDEKALWLCQSMAYFFRFITIIKGLFGASGSRKGEG